MSGSLADDALDVADERESLPSGRTNVRDTWRTPEAPRCSVYCRRSLGDPGAPSGPVRTVALSVVAGRYPVRLSALRGVPSHPTRTQTSWYDQNFVLRTLSVPTGTVSGAHGGLSGTHPRVYESSRPTTLPPVLRAHV